jgi:hypothetical protein
MAITTRRLPVWCLGKTTILAVCLGVLWADMTAKIRAINLDVAFQNFARVDLLCHGFAQLVGQHKRCLVLAAQIAGKLDHGHALGGVHNDADRGQQVHEVHLATGKDRAGCDAKRKRPV